MCRSVCLMQLYVTYESDKTTKKKSTRNVTSALEWMAITFFLHTELYSFFVAYFNNMIMEAEIYYLLTC